MARETQKAKIERLEQEIKEKDKLIHDLYLKLEMNKRNHNDRGAGRKTRFTETEKETIRMYRVQGKTIKEIADFYKCSAGLIHKVIHEK